jgi:hypothetical protein
MPNPPVPPLQGHERPPLLQQPGFGSYSSYPYESPSAYHHFPHSGQHPTPMPGLTSPFQYHHARTFHYGPYSSTNGQRAGVYPPPTDSFQHELSPIPPAGFHNLHMADPQDLLPMADQGLPNHHQPYNYSPYLPTPNLHGLNPYLASSTSPVMPDFLTARTARYETMQSIGRIPPRGAPVSSPDQPRQVTSPPRRQPYERPQQQPSQVPVGPERRPLTYSGTSPRRSDRSISPRTSHRRNFDRYASDLPQTRTLDAEEAAVRARNAQRRRIRARNSQAAYMDSMVATPGQIQALKDKLRHFLPSQLPEGSSTCCDICSKDYSAKHCMPTEEDEVAIQLPCKHVFGEFCFNTWLDTCTKHKNKLTCPMCRKVLVEPIRGPPSGGIPAMMALFSSSALATMSPAERENIFARFRDVGHGLGGDQ